MTSENKSQRQKLTFTERRKSVAADYVRGVTQSELAQRYGVNQATISRDLEAIRQEWRHSTLVDFNEAKQRELAKIDALEQEYWQAWRESQKERSETSSYKSGEIARVGIRKVKRDGNAAFLAGVQWCIEQRCKILGLNAPTKNEHSGPNGRPIPLQADADVNLKNLSFDELLELKRMADKARHGEHD